MKHRVGILAVLLAAMCATAARADVDDDRWIKRCISDNSDQEQSAETVGVYCSCMNEHMSSNETLSITAWEKKNPDIQERCSKRAKWRN